MAKISTINQLNDPIKQYDEVRKAAIGQDEDYAHRCILDYAYFKDNYKLIAVDLSKQKALHGIQSYQTNCWSKIKN